MTLGKLGTLSFLVAMAGLLGIGASAGAADSPFLRGDSSGDGQVNLADAVGTLNFLFQGAEAPGCPDASDANDDGELDIADPIATLNFLFLGGTRPPAPFPDPGPDPTPDTLPPCLAASIWMGRPDGCFQCRECQAADLETVVTELEAAGIEVREARWGFVAVCLACDICPSGRFYLVLVSSADAARIEELGWRRFEDP